MAQVAVRPAAPPVVKVVVIGLALLAVLNIVRAVVQVPYNLSHTSYGDAARILYVGLNAITVLFSLFVLLLAWFLWQGRQWAWITCMPLLGLAALWGGIMLLPPLVDGKFPGAGLTVLAVAVGMLLALTAPASARRFFTRR
ncbi:hypothetical protein AB0F81_22320 [Actinoplanes sp. NPDC024001]|uniref:hypothetical protein n=1 Tax=Actinoplanes sp. NPDC024001 TaxID=3154598 RepID=UPI00340C5627